MENDETAIGTDRTRLLGLFHVNSHHPGLAFHRLVFDSFQQFFAMLMHRFGTLAHIIASTDLFCFRKPMDKLSEDDLVVQNAVEIAKELQAIRGIDEPGEGPVQVGIEESDD
jgi:hypothetical protein